MPATTSFINTMLDTAFTGGTLTMKLFTVGLPSTTGVEVSGGSYAAQTFTMTSAAAKKKSASATIVFTNLPTGTPIVAYGVYKAGTLVQDALLSPAFTPDITNNELQITYSFELNV
jgi:hypothetical protein